MENLDEDNLKDLMLKAIRDEWIDILNMMGKWDIYHLSLPEISELCIHISRVNSRVGKNSRDSVISRINQYATGTISRDEIGNLLDEVKTNILGSLSEQIYTLKLKNKQRVESNALSIFCPKCRKKHALRECPLDLKSVETCVICT